MARRKSLLDLVVGLIVLCVLCSWITLAPTTTISTTSTTTSTLTTTQLSSSLLRSNDNDNNDERKKKQKNTGVPMALRYHHILVKQQQQQQIQKNNNLQRTKRGALSVLIFTMDSLKVYVEISKGGGARGELLIRQCLENSLKSLGHVVRTCDSDICFESQDHSQFDKFFLDPWTALNPDNSPRGFIANRTSDVFILDFFGRNQAMEALPGIPLSHYLSAFPLSKTSFLGFYISPPRRQKSLMNDGQSSMGFLWGKQEDYFTPRMKEGLLQISDEFPEVEMYSSVPVFKRNRPRFTKIGVVDTARWISLLQRSRFLLGVGDPLLGPSVIEAISQGVMVLIPKFPEGGRPYGDGLVAISQHDYLLNHAPEEYVCVYRIDEAQWESLRACVGKALRSRLEPLILPSFSEDSHRERVAKILSS